MQQHTTITIDSVIGDYHVIAELGRGAYGTVYRARHAVLDREAAIKVFEGAALESDTALRRFQREAGLLRDSANKHIVQILSIGKLPDNRPYMVLELVQGHTLADELKQTGTISAGRTVEIARQVLSALRHAHGLGIVHRDIKPSNIMLSEADGELLVKVVDFGVAKVDINAFSELEQLTKDGSTPGTPLYMSPEQCAGKEALPTSDLYSLGCVMYEALTGRPPFDSGGAYEVMYRHLHEQPPPLQATKQIPAAITSAIMKPLAKEQKKRFDSAEQMQTALENAVKNGSPLLTGTRCGIISGALLICACALLSINKTTYRAPRTVLTLNAAVDQAHQYISRYQLKSGMDMIAASLKRQRHRSGDFAVAWVLLSYAYYSRRELDDAMRALNRAMQYASHDPTYAAPLARNFHLTDWYATLCFARRDPTLARMCLKNLEHNFGSCISKEFLGKIELLKAQDFESQGRYDQAVSALKQALTYLDDERAIKLKNVIRFSGPNKPPFARIQTLQCLARVYSELHDKGNADEAVAQIIADHSRNGVKAGDYYIDGLSETFIRTMNYQAAEEYLQRVIGVLRHDEADICVIAPLLADRAWLLHVDHQPAGNRQAKELIIEALQFFDQHPHDYLRGKAYMIAGAIFLSEDNQRALNYLERAEQALVPQLSEWIPIAYWLLGKAHWQCNETKLANEYFKKSRDCWVQYRSSDQFFKSMTEDYNPLKRMTKSE